MFRIIKKVTSYLKDDEMYFTTELKHLEEEPNLKNNLMELMTGGKYIGGTANYIIKDLKEQGLIKLMHKNK